MRFLASVMPGTPCKKGGGGGGGGADTGKLCGVSTNLVNSFVGNGDELVFEPLRSNCGRKMLVCIMLCSLFPKLLPRVGRELEVQRHLNARQDVPAKQARCDGWHSLVSSRVYTQQLQLPGSTNWGHQTTATRARAEWSVLSQVTMRAHRYASRERIVCALTTKMSGEMRSPRCSSCCQMIGFVMKNETPEWRAARRWATQMRRRTDSLRLPEEVKTMMLRCVCRCMMHAILAADALAAATGHV